MPVLEEGQPLVFFIRHIEPNHTNHLQTVHGNVEISWVIRGDKLGDIKI